MDTLDRAVQRMTLLVLVLLFLLYNQGGVNLLQALGSFLGNITRILQGIGPNGQPYNYPK